MNERYIPHEKLDKQPTLTVGYEQRLRDLLNYFHEKSAQNVPVHLGPKYNITTSTGEPLTIRPVSLESPMPNLDGVNSKVYVLFAQNKNGYIVGDRNIEILPAQTNVDSESGETITYSQAEGYINTGVRGEGVAIPLNLAMIDILQREANRLGHEIRWEVTNNTIRKVTAVRKEYMDKLHIKSTPQEELERLDAEIQKLEPDSDHWQYLYGYQGKLGFKVLDDEHSEKVFFPQNQQISSRADDYSNLESIDLGRTDSEPYYKINSQTKKSSDTEDEELHELWKKMNAGS